MREILRQKPDWEFYFIAPNHKGSIHERVYPIPLEHGKNKFESRFNFPWRDLEGKLVQVMPKVDLMYVNQSELATNFRALAATLVPERRIPLVSYFHYVPIEPPHFHFEPGAEDYDLVADLEGQKALSSLRFDHTQNKHGLARQIFMRQIEALDGSDCSITCSKFGADLLVGSAQKIVPSVSPKMAVIAPPVSFEEAKLGTDIKKADKKRILFNHRLYSHYGPRELFGFLDQFYERVRKDFEVLVTDPTHGKSAERQKLDPNATANKEELLRRPYVKLVHSAGREDYYRELGKCHMTIGPFKPSALWSMSVVDAMACGVPAVCPYYACFPEMLGVGSNLLFSTPKQLSDLINNLFDDKEFYKRASSYCTERARRFSVENTAKKFIDVFEREVEGNGK
jgi:glycosyltransferase involved in cell wall biosynthesis